MKIMVTGPRSIVELTLEERLAIVDRIAIQFEKIKPKLIHIGMAEGFDEFSVYAAVRLGIPFIACLPSPGYGQYYWRDHSKTGLDRFARFEAMLEKASDIIVVCRDHQMGRANFLRNTYMVERSELVVSYLESYPSPGTRHALREARNHKLDIVFTEEVPF
jgi:hypothetical protein